jgi:Cu-Zn family superoxide dismutase
MSRFIAPALVVALLAPVGGFAADEAVAPGAGDARTVEVTFRNAKKQPIGDAVLRQTPNGVLITMALRDLPQGEHGFHIHEVGKCEPPFESAGGHFNPTSKKHGFEMAQGPHAGDLPNLIVPDSGKVKLEYLARDVTLDEGKPGSLLKKDGTALVIHAGPDDYTTDPAGNSGARIACGSIVPPSPEAGRK